MIQLKTMKHIATSQMIPSVRSLASLERYSDSSTHDRAADLGRMQANIGRMQGQKARRNWLNQQWKKTPSQRRSH